MTASFLLGVISLGLLLQLAIGIAVAVSRRGRAVPIDAPPAGEPTAPLAAWPGWRAFRVTARRFEDSAQTQCSFHLAPIDGAPLPPFLPGQFLTFSLKIGEDGTRNTVRCYSLSDRPDPTGYRVTIKRALAPDDKPDLPPGLASGHFHDRLAVGDIVMAKAPAGQFTLDPDPGIVSVLIAGGIGITPMISMLAEALHTQPDRPMHLVYGVRTPNDCAFLPTLEALAKAYPSFVLHLVCSRPDTDSSPGHLAGRIDIALLRRVVPLGRNRYYLCGPPAMVTGLARDLRASGVPEADIRSEAFGPAIPGQPLALLDDAAKLSVQFKRSGRTLFWDGQDASLLDFAERHGVPIESGCRAGSCGTCATHVLAGALRYPVKPDQSPEAGFGLLCIATPTTNLVLDA